MISEEQKKLLKDIEQAALNIDIHLDWMAKEYLKNSLLTLQNAGLLSANWK